MLPNVVEYQTPWFARATENSEEPCREEARANDCALRLRKQRKSASVGRNVSNLIHREKTKGDVRELTCRFLKFGNGKHLSFVVGDLNLPALARPDTSFCNRDELAVLLPLDRLILSQSDNTIHNSVQLLLKHFTTNFYDATVGDSEHACCREGQVEHTGTHARSTVVDDHYD